MFLSGKELENALSIFIVLLGLMYLFANISVPFHKGPKDFMEKNWRDDKNV